MSTTISDQLLERKMWHEEARAEQARLDAATRAENTELRRELNIVTRAMLAVGEQFNRIIEEQTATILALRLRLTNLENVHMRNVAGAFIAGAGVACTVLQLFWCCIKNKGE